MLRLSDYLLTPRDIFVLVRGWQARDWRGIGICLIIGLIIGVWLADPSAGLFAAGLAGALYWRLDARWPLGAALVLLVLIPVTQLLYDYNLVVTAGNWGESLAVAVWYLLAIGVVRQIVELRSLPAEAPARTAPAAAPDVARAVASRSGPLRLSKRQQRAMAYRVLARIERLRRGIDGIYRRRRP